MEGLVDRHRPGRESEPETWDRVHAPAGVFSRCAATCKRMQIMYCLWPLTAQWLTAKNILLVDSFTCNVLCVIFFTSLWVVCLEKSYCHLKLGVENSGNLRSDLIQYRAQFILWKKNSSGNEKDVSTQANWVNRAVLGTEMKLNTKRNKKGTKHELLYPW